MLICAVDSAQAPECLRRACRALSARRRRSSVEPEKQSSWKYTPMPSIHSVMPMVSSCMTGIARSTSAASGSTGFHTPRREAGHKPRSCRDRLTAAGAADAAVGEPRGSIGLVRRDELGGRRDEEQGRVSRSSPGHAPQLPAPRPFADGAVNPGTIRADRRDYETPAACWLTPLRKRPPVAIFVSSLSACPSSSSVSSSIDSALPRPSSDASVLAVP